jgi:hypothetical protein
MSEPPEYRLFAHRNRQDRPTDERNDRIAAFRSSQSVSGSARHEAVADAAGGDDQLGVVGVILDLESQTPYVGVDET